MNYGLIPTNPLERLALWSGRVPVPAIDALFSLLKARSLMSASKLGVFQALAEGPGTAAELAYRLSLDEDSLELLLRALTHSGYLLCRGRTFRLSKLSKRSLIKGGPLELMGYLEWNYTQWEMLEHLESLLQTGHGVQFHETMTESADWAAYQRAMMELARQEAPVIARRVPVDRGATRLLDIAGSHGLYGAALCRLHPPLRSTVLELPAALEHARSLAETEGIASLVEHRAGNLLTSDFGVDWNVVLLSNILHHFDGATCLGILCRAHAALGGGGTVAIWDLEAPDRDCAPTASDAGALYFKLCSGATCYSGQQFATWLAEAGFTKVKKMRPPTTPGQVLVVGRRG